MIYDNFSVINFRDLGTVKTKDGRRLKKNIIFRGGAFNNVNEEDKKILNNFGFKHIFDLRSRQELDRDDFYFIPDNANYHHYAEKIRDELKIDLDLLNGSNKNNFYEWLVNLYCELPHNNIAYKEIFEVLINNELPIYFHCSAGKDRTGVFAALLLDLLGVDRNDIITEYLLSLPNMIRLIEHYDENDIKFVNDYWINKMFETLDHKYPNHDDYFYYEFKINEEIKEKIKNNLLEV